MSSCASKKEAARTEAERQQRESLIKDVRAQLLDLVVNDTKSIEQKQKELDDIKSLNIGDPELDDIIFKLQKKLSEDLAEQKRKEKEELAKNEKAKNQKEMVNARKEIDKNQIENFFREIQLSRTPADADRLINDCLLKFENDDIPVLILISQEGNEKDYDKPTTIRKYLEYLKDNRIKTDNTSSYSEFQSKRKVNNAVLSFQYNENFKIKELELIKM